MKKLWGRTIIIICSATWSQLPSYKVLKQGSPLIINFESLEPTSANKMLAFFAGACYALDGRNVKINEKTYLFARRVDFFDGSIQKFIDSLPKE